MAEKVIWGGGLVVSTTGSFPPTSGSIIITGVTGMGWAGCESFGRVWDGGGSLALAWDVSVTNTCSVGGLEVLIFAGMVNIINFFKDSPYDI